MRYLLITLSLLFCFIVSGQVDDSTSFTEWQMGDTIYKNLGNKASTGFLHNRLFLDPSKSLTNNAFRFNYDTSSFSVSGDHMYGLIDELRIMAFDSTSIPSSLKIYDSINSFVGKHHFEDQAFVYPMTIFDFEFNIIDDSSGLADSILGKDFETLIDLQPENNSIVSTHRASLIGPLFDYHYSSVMGLVFRKEDFRSNIRSMNDISQLAVKEGENWRQIEWDTIYGFTPSDSYVQNIKFKITYNDGYIITNNVQLKTYEAGTASKSASGIISALYQWNPEGCAGFNGWNPGCQNCGVISDALSNKLKWCYIPSCLKQNLTNPKPTKPYILVAGWRPPVVGQSFKKTWNAYNHDHAFMLSSLKKNDFDIFLVQFNIHWKPYKHGMQESADLLTRFITELNTSLKLDNTHENVIQGSSMGADIIRLALLKMEKMHLADNNYAHHHTRLFISHDANFYGANIPLAYTYQIYSNFGRPHIASQGYNYFLGVPNFLRVFLFATMEQKSMKELLLYHPTSNVPKSTFFLHNFDYSFTPTLHPGRQAYYNALNAVDNHTHIFPMPIATRNIAISLGKIAGVNTNTAAEGGSFKAAGGYWHNINLGVYKLRMGAAKYMPAGQTFQLFKRQFYQPDIFPFSWQVKHIVNVSQMQEIDNAAGSYLRGTANMISIVDWTYFPLSQIFNGKDFFSHKAVVTALGINKNLWPANGSMTLNMQSMGLMYNQHNFNPNFPSNHYGYPHLGNPTNHFQITPFEAIYVDNEIDPHIQLGDANQGDVAQLNGFIFNEVEPWFLGLQNQNVGSTARSNYTYNVFRRAKNTISVGHHVTPMTNDGDYVAEPNSVVNLRAGESIQLSTGVHFKPGSVCHLKIEYVACSD